MLNYRDFIDYRDPGSVFPLSEATGLLNKLPAPGVWNVDQLADNMFERGWIGAPILVVGEAALTGTHRVYAARMIGLPEIPVVDVFDFVDDSAELAGAIRSLTGWDNFVAYAELARLVLGNPQARELGIDIYYDPRELSQALDVSPTETYAALLESVAEDN